MSHPYLKRFMLELVKVDCLKYIYSCQDCSVFCNIRMQHEQSSVRLHEPISCLTLDKFYGIDTLDKRFLDY